MIKPKIKKAINPRTGKLIIQERWPNICIYGLSEKEKEVLGKSLPHPKITVEDVTNDVISMIEISSFINIINPDNITDEDLSFYYSLFKDCDGMTETVVFTKYKPGLNELFNSVDCIMFNDFSEYKDNIKYEMLQLLKKRVVLKIIQTLYHKL